MISAAQQIRLVAPADGVAPVSSVIDDTLLLRKPEAKLRCFVEGGSSRSLPALGGVDYELDPRADYDLILLPSDADPSAIGRLLGQANSPAPVIISRYETLGARADLVLCDWTDQSLSTPILSVMPLLTRVSELPRKPLGPDRNGLSALALAYTRDCSLAPLLRPDDPALLPYPLLPAFRNPRHIPQELPHAGLPPR